eukprot:727979-Amphidinium_carterae.1
MLAYGPPVLCCPPQNQVGDLVAGLAGLHKNFRWGVVAANTFIVVILTSKVKLRRSSRGLIPPFCLLG